MKFHYFNILFFAFPLNILVTSCHVYNRRNHKSITLHTPNENLIKTRRSLCECKLYSPANYDSDPQMKEVMDNFNKQTQQRFHEYDERMKTTRQKCKDKCDKEIQNIILKDKLEKQMAEQLTTLETKIDTDDIPTCICEKSLADKVEKGCLRCGGVLGGGVAPSIGLLGGPGIYGWKAAALVTAKELAEKAGAAAGEAARIPAAIDAVIAGVKSTLGIEKLGGATLESFFTAQTYTDVTLISGAIQTEYSSCLPHLAVSGAGAGHLVVPGAGSPICNTFDTLYVFTGKFRNRSLLQGYIQEDVAKIVAGAEQAAKAKAAMVASAEKAAVLETSKKAIEATSYNWYTTIAYSITAILIIVLIMVIIYLILRYRRKKKMKKKLQYIKLLEE